MKKVKKWIRRFLEVDFEFDETILRLNKSIIEATKVLDALERQNQVLLNRILNCNSMIQLQAMFIESKKLRKEFNKFTSNYGYKYKKSNKKNEDDKNMITT